MISQLDNLLKFDELKNTIITLISNKEADINHYEANHDAWIYLLYVDNFEDNRIIPFYIGQTTDFKRRYRNHIRDIKKLMEYSYAEYHQEFLLATISHKPAFYGKYRPCKIFKYMRNHNCTIDDVKMIILEKCEKELLDEREQYYLSLYLPSYFGFNQISTITEQFKYRNNPQKMQEIINMDYLYFQNYMEYGYSAFNYLNAFTGYGSHELEVIVNGLLSNHLWKPQEVLFKDVIIKSEIYKKEYKAAYDMISDKLGDTIHYIFMQYKFKSKSREMQVIEVFTNHIQTPIVDDVNNNLEYLEYYFSRDIRSAECGSALKVLYLDNKDYIEEAICSSKKAYEEYIEARQNAVEQSKYSLIC